MPRRSTPGPHPVDAELFATIPVTHAARRAERAAEFAAHPSRTRGPECIVIGHAWSEDPAREGWLICIACEVVRPS